MEIITNYSQDPVLRAGFNRLAEATFGLSFESWYQNGFWTESYRPYSILEDGKIVANVSLNRTDLRIRGQVRRVYQLGTVMTDPAYRNRGYIRLLMERVWQDIRDAEGIYLFANDSVLDFYPKFGFRKGTEHVFTASVHQEEAASMIPVPMDGVAAWQRLARAMARSAPQGEAEMVGNPGLIFFYVSQFMQDNVYYSEALNTWAIAELEAGELLLHAVFCPEERSLDTVIRAFGPAVTQVTLGFTPQDSQGFACRELKEEDTTFFVQGPLFQDFAPHRIPSLAHA